METKRTIPKQSWKPGNMLSPVPAVLVSCGGTGEWQPNLITIAWTGTVCSNPPMLSIAVRPERYSYEIIRQTGEFTVNLPSAAQARITDWCGVVSGRDCDKFEETGLTPAPGIKTNCPIVAECPVNIECKVTQTLELGSHVLFLAEVVAVQASKELIDAQGRLHLERAGLIAYVHGAYYALGPYLGHFGFSVRKKKPVARRKTVSKPRKNQESKPRKKRT
jgi:flavin reductase (DIM6/NTAB) family NADH-FMN oxidoreductase RutF